MRDENKPIIGEEYLPSYENLKFSGNETTQTPIGGAKPSPMDYFKQAKILVYCTGGSILLVFILIFISEWVGKHFIYNTMLSIVKDFLYPFLTLMIGYMFGKGFSNNHNE